MSWAEDKAREIGGERILFPGYTMLGWEAREMVERAIRETIAECAKKASDCAAERKAQLEHLLAEGPPDQRHTLVVAKCSEAERIAEAIGKLAAP